MGIFFSSSQSMTPPITYPEIYSETTPSITYPEIYPETTPFTTPSEIYPKTTSFTTQPEIYSKTTRSKKYSKTTPPLTTTPLTTTPLTTTPLTTTPLTTTPLTTRPLTTTPLTTTPLTTTPLTTTPLTTRPLTTRPLTTRPLTTPPLTTRPEIYPETTPSFTTYPEIYPETTPPFTTPFTTYPETTPSFTPLFTPPFTTPFTTYPETTPSFTPPFTTYPETTPSFTIPLFTTPPFITPQFITPPHIIHSEIQSETKSFITDPEIHPETTPSPFTPLLTTTYISNGSVSGNTYCSGPLGSIDNKTNKNMICIDGMDVNNNYVACDQKLYSDNTQKYSFRCVTPQYYGNNGTSSGNTYCAGKGGIVNNTQNKNMICIGGTDGSGNYIDCSGTNSVGNYGYLCLTPQYNGNNGTLSGHAFCAGPSGSSNNKTNKKMICLSGVDGNGNYVDCSGTNPIGNYNYYCVAPNFIDNNAGSASTFCNGPLQNTNGTINKNLKCIGALDDMGNVISCNTINSGTSLKNYSYLCK